MSQSKRLKPNEVSSLRHLAGVPHAEEYAKLADLNIKHGNKLLPCHSSALAMHSKVLATMFNDVEKTEWASGVSAVLAEHAFDDVESFLSTVHTPGSKFKNAPEFTWKVKNYSMLATNSSKQTSPVFEIGGYTWKLLMYPRGNPNASPPALVKHLSLYLAVDDPVNGAVPYQRNGAFKLTLVNQSNPSESVVKEANHVFTPEQDDWGFPNFIPLNEVEQFLYNDTLIVQVEATITAPDEEQQACDSTKETGTVGLGSMEGVARLAHQLDAPSILTAIEEYLCLREQSLKPLVWLPRPETSSMPRVKAACRKILLESLLSGVNDGSVGTYPDKLKDIKRCENGSWKELPNDDLCAILQGVMRALPSIRDTGTDYEVTERDLVAYLK